MSQVLEILSLQTIDDEIASYRASIAELERRLQGDEELDEARRGLAEATADRGRIRKDQRRIDGEVAALSDKIASEEKRLYDGSIKNPKELTNIQHEVDLLKASRGKLEDELIEILEAVETTGRSHKELTGLVASLEARWQNDQESFTQELRRLQGLLTGAEARREAQKAKVAPRAILMYDDLRRRKGGMAVSRVVGSTCSGCRVSIPDAIRRRVMAAADFAQCPNCERILALG